MRLSPSPATILAGGALFFALGANRRVERIDAALTLVAVQRPCRRCETSS
jgi:hypothetical protein